MVDKTPYKRSLGLIELVSLGVGGTIGSGIFVVPGVAARLSGAASLYIWLIVAISASCVLISLAAVSTQFTGSGSFYSLFESVFGKNVAVTLILLYLVSSIFGVSTIAAGIGQYITWLGITHALTIEVVILAAFCCINIVGISLSGKTENILTTLKIIPLILISVLLIPFIRPENLVTSASVSNAGLLATIIIVYWPFTGFEISAIPVEETKDPRMIKTSLLYVMAIVVAVYLLLNISLIGSVGAPALAASPAPVATAAALIVVHAGPVVAIIGIIAMLSALNAYIIGTSRVMQSLSARFAVPRIRDLGMQGTPVYALITSCGLCAALLFISNQFDKLASISVITTLIPYIFFCIAAWMTIQDTLVRIVSVAGAGSTLAILAIYFIA